MTEQVPTNTLLSWLWIVHTIEVDNAFEAASFERVGRCFRISLPMWTNGLRLIPEDGTTVASLRQEARAVCNLAGLERWGWITVGDEGATRRHGFGTQRGIKDTTVVRPTRAGSYARRLWPRVVTEIEQRWRIRFGNDNISGLTDILLTRATAMPWSVPEVHPSDGFFTHIVSDDGAAAVETEAMDGPRPLVALLGQTLTELTFDLECEAATSAPLSANVLRVIGPDAVAIADLPRLTGLSPEGITMAVGFMQRSGLATPAPGRAVSLSPQGAIALQGYAHWAARQDDSALRSALEVIVAQSNGLSAGLVPAAGCWRGEKPYLAHTQRLVADPTGNLPWHPMVLHRGAWPDAS